ncbi:MAG: N-formylglutamate amidohydrolase [Spirochaetes bacterium]|jgi:formiminoglutamase|nr:N-formylglutamate amidohydrolase [Spirochaetota bacterium]
MKSHIPILIIIPHGGLNVPDELSGYEQIDKFGIFIESDVCANELFSLEGGNAVKIDTDISRLFVDLDRSLKSITVKSDDGIIKKETVSGRKIFKDKIFPDEIAVSNILRRYYKPFHDTIEKIIKTGGIKFIVECHTMTPVGPRKAPDAGKPRPLINIETIAKTERGSVRTCPDELAEELASIFNKIFNDEESSVAGRTVLNNPRKSSHILNKYGPSGIPMIRLSISRSLFLNDKYFSYDYLKVDDLRINELKAKISTGIEKFISRNF